ncbi:hypothetical protein HDV06_006596 [Boothiomyces sp. JEL0866]|nr:hypothetical protein HDV06_006596 [Boothiomyces sp. JEL0866]
MNLVYLIAVLSRICECLSPNGTIQIKVGVLMFYTNGVNDLADEIEGVFVRIDQLNHNTSLIHPNAKIVPTLLNNQGSKALLIPQALSSALDGEIFVFGSGYSSMSILSSLILQNYQIPMCCGSSTNPTLGRKDLYSNFFRTIPNDNAAAQTMAQYLAANGWYKIATVNTDEDYGNGAISSFLNYASALNITILSRQLVETDVDAKAAYQIAQQIISAEARIIVYFGFAAEYEVIVQQATLAGCYGPGYFWIGTDGLQQMVPTTAYAGTSYLFPLERAEGAVADTFDAYWNANRLNVGNPGGNVSSVSSSGPFGYFHSSCVDLMVLGFDALVKAHGNNVTKLANGELNKLMLVPQSFNFPDHETTTGKINLDANGDRSGDYAVMNVQADASLVQVSKWSNGVEYQIQPYYYPGGANYKPADSLNPANVADYLQTTGDALGIIAIILFFIGAITSLVCLAGISIYRNHPMVRASDVFVGFVMQLCILFSWFDLLTMLNKPTKVSCICDSFILPITFSVYYGLMLIKNYRVYMIFNRPTRYVLKTYQTIIAGIIFGIPAAIIVAVWHAIDSPKPAALEVVKAVYAWTCSSTSTDFQSNIVLALSIYCALVLLLNLFIAFQTRNVPSKYSETKLITISIYNTAIVTLFAISLLLSPGLGFRLKAGVKMFAVFYVLYFNLLSTFLMKVVSCAKGQGLTTRSFGNSSQSHSQTTTKEDNKTSAPKEVKKPKAGTAVILKKLGMFGESSPRILVSESTDLISLCRFTKITLEDKNPTRRGDGDCWKLSNLNYFKMDAVSKTSRKYFLDYDVFEIIYESEEDARIWDQFFQGWTNKYASQSLMGGSMMK